MPAPRRRRPLVPWLLLPLVLAGGIWAGGHPGRLPGAVRDALVGDKDTRVVREAIDRVHDTYYRAIPKSTLADDAIAGIVRTLDDRFSHYFDPAAYRRFQQFQNSEFSGVGITVRHDRRGLRVLTVFRNSPARRAGIRRGDVIVAAGGTSLRGKSQNASVRLITGRPGTAVRLTYLHFRQRRTVTLTRATISVPVVQAHVRQAGGRRLGVLALGQFSAGAHGEVVGTLRRLLARHVRGIVLDLRGNGGGLVHEAQLVASAFLRGGPIVTTRGRDVPERTLDAVGDPVVPTLPVVVLVDRNTASAAEIVAGALQDRKRATLVGLRTFGKGVFQEIVELSNGGALDITAGQYFTPSGRNLGGRGVKTGRGLVPQVRARDNPRTRRDEALAVALRVLARRAK